MRKLYLVGLSRLYITLNDIGILYYHFGRIIRFYIFIGQRNKTIGNIGTVHTTYRW